MGADETAAIQAAGERIMESLGNSAVYYPDNGDPVDCTVHLDEDIKISPEGFELQVYQPTKTIEALYHEIGQIPKKGERFVIGSYSYTVKTVLEQDGIFVLMGVGSGSLV